MILAKPDYYDSFRCIAGACPDSCCKEWDVQIDDAAAAFYRSLPGALGDRLREVLRDEDGETVMTIVEGRCPMWQQDGLCRIQAQLGEAALSKVCREFPRLIHDYGDFQELGLELSCPEAARLILNAQSCRLTQMEVPSGEEPEYDEEAMACLKASRETALAILEEPRSPAISLALLLLYGYQAQGELDGDDPAPFDRAAALESLPRFAKAGSISRLVEFFRGLEILTPQWEKLLRSPAPRDFCRKDLAFAGYLVNRYWLQAVSDYDLTARVKLIVICCLLVAALGGTPEETAQLFSKEIENDVDNVDAILEGAYTNEAFTDDRLLGLLLERA